MFRVSLGSSLNLISVSIKSTLLRTLCDMQPHSDMLDQVQLYSSLPHCDIFIKLYIKFAVRCCK